MQNKWTFGVFLSMCLTISVVSYRDSIVDIEAAKNGLQQCLINNKILWKKECTGE